MGETVAIALITALATLTAAGLTGLVTALTVRRQVAGQLTAAREERAEQRAQRRDQDRRDAYLGFLAACDQAYRELDRDWVGPDGSRGTGVDSPYAALRGLDEAYNRVLLAGPEPAADAAGAVVRSVNEEYAGQRRLTPAAGTGGEPLAGRCRPEHRAAIGARARQRDEFVAAARRVLDPGGAAALARGRDATPADVSTRA
ncbi:hypothetical protein [Micromonospora fluostatini]|uniref:hypothetical protein n=1 Tax=Micromonospora sp. JCM 30529 TaxID=3421643 RepID=UPI003D178E84